MNKNKVYNESCLDTMSRMDNNFIDLTVTSPPYDNMRSYKDGAGDNWGEHIWKPAIKELFRVTKDGGVVVWIVGDRKKNGNESGTSFRQCLFFQESGFNIHDTMIYRKINGAMGAHNEYLQEFEYMFIFSKGKINKPNLIYDRENVVHGNISTVKVKSGKEGTKKERHIVEYKKLGRRKNIWSYPVGGKQKGGYHPAIFPEKLANDHIISWSNVGDLVYDPFMGSGTTARMSILNDRNWIGSELVTEYCDMTNKIINT